MNMLSTNFIGAVKDKWQLYSDNSTDYTLGRPIGFGASSVVYEATFHPNRSQSIPCALKVLDLESLPIYSLGLLRRETQLMSLSKHPNVLRVRGTWIDGHKLYIALRLMRSGSIADIIHHACPNGIEEEEVIKCILKQALEGLNYLHINGFIHRDIKAANLLVDDDGTVLLGDLGVAVALHDDDNTPRRSSIVTSSSYETSPIRPVVVPQERTLGKRKSFVGTPCWMAPEVVSQRNYDTKADIWSLGITALELAQGKPPNFKDPPNKVLLKIVYDKAPSLNRLNGRFKYSKAFQDMIHSCLSKDPNTRPTAEELLKFPFFRNVKKKNFLVSTLLRGLPPLIDRQEKRNVPLSIATSPFCSWDFSLTGPSTSKVQIPQPSSFGDVSELFKADGLHLNGTSQTSSYEASLRESLRSCYRIESPLLFEYACESPSYPSCYPSTPKVSHTAINFWSKLKGFGSINSPEIVKSF
ncbi:hypothetical protein Clacol_003732 [Clathrus columnatus]|uniref:Protein kinase domain-containing protein n=1 Tax=Clathrus columnatus TaxID=1419009 RepID=A0AAV5A4F1_9AGAM|nr:hypothetical protein Clacol_003732 [Clathrus columnatus]